MSYRSQIKYKQKRDARLYGGNYGANTDAQGKSWFQNQRAIDPNFGNDMNRRQLDDAYWNDQRGGPSNLPSVNDMPQRGVTVNALPGYAINSNGLLVKAAVQGAPVNVALPGSIAAENARKESLKNAGRSSQVIDFARPEHVLGGQALWTDQTVEDRQKQLQDPAFYKNNEITKFSPEVQQQILADPAFDWKQVPAWQKSYFEFSSKPTEIGPLKISSATKMGLAQGLVMGAGNPGGAVVGGVIGTVAGISGYDQRKEWWQQGEGKFTFDKQQVKDTVNAGMGLMNWAAEQAEKTIGLAAQIGNAASDPNKTVADVLKDPKAAYNAGSSFFEVIAPALQAANQGNGRLGWEDAIKIIPGIWQAGVVLDVVRHPEKYKGEERYLGAVMPVELEKTWIQRLDQARSEIANGRNEREVMTEMQTGLMAQLGDLAGQGIADPLNVMPKVKLATYGAIAEIGGNKVLAEAYHQSSSPHEAAQKYKTFVQTGMSKTIDPDFEIKNYQDPLMKFIGGNTGINKSGQIKAGLGETGLLDKRTGNEFDYSGPLSLVGNAIKNPRGFFEHMTQLDPYSRAQAGAGMFYENIGTLLTQLEDVRDAGKYLRALAKGDMETWKELGSKFADSPEFYTVLPALKDFNANKLDAIIQVWDMTQGNRDMLNSLADILATDPAKLLDDWNKKGTSEQDFTRLVERLKESTDPKAKVMLADVEAGKFTAETLKQTVDIYSGKDALPYDARMAKDLMLDALGDHFDKWTSERLMLDKSPEATKAFFRTTALMKQAQSILLLGGSPGYAITNGLSAMVHRAFTGNFGYLSQPAIKRWNDRMEITPARFDEGVGIGGQVESGTKGGRVKTKAIDKAVKGKGPLTAAKELMGKFSKGMPFSKVASMMEKYEGNQAFTIGAKKFWNQSWRRGVGFSKMSPELVAELGKAGYSPDRVYRMIEASMNQGELGNNLYGERQAAIQTRTLMEYAAQKKGMSMTQASEMFDTLGLFDQLDDALKGRSNSADGIRAAFDRVRRQANDYADMQRGEDLKAIIESTKQRTALEGATAGLDLVQKAHATYFDTWLDHYSRFGEIMNDLKLLDDPAQRNKAIDFSYQLSDEEFRHVEARTAATYNGMFEAYGLSGNPNALEMLSAFGDGNKVMSDAYRQMRDIRKGFFEKWRDDMGNPASYDEWAANDHQIKNIFKQAFEAKKQAEIRQGEALSKIYEGMYGPAAGEAARQWWEEVIKFNDEITARERTKRDEWAQARAAGVPKDLIDAQKTKYYEETKPAMIIEADRINGEGIARLERVIKGGSGQGTEDGGTPPSTPPSPAGSDAANVAKIAEAEAKQAQKQKNSVEEFKTMQAAAEQRRADTAKANADRMTAIWDIAENFDHRGLPYDHTVLQDKFALLSALRKPEYGGLADLRGFDDPRLTPEFAQGVMEKRQAVKESQVAGQISKAIGSAQDAAANVKAPKINENTTILRAISELGGISKTLTQDITGEKRPKTAPGVFTNQGRGIDEIARLLVDEGYPIDLNDPNDIGGVQQTTALINRARTGDKVYPISHDYEAALARAQDQAAGKAFAESFDLEAVPEVAFDQVLWQTEFADTIQRADLTRMYELIGDFPEDLSNTRTPDGETYADFMSRVADETAARVEADARDQAIAEHKTRADQAIIEQEVRAEAVTTRQLMQEKFQEVFRHDQVILYMQLSEALAGWVRKATGENQDAFYTRYYKDVVRTEGGGQGMVDALKQSYGRIEVADRTMTQVDAENYARMLVRGGEGELRRAIRNETNKADRIAILDAAHKLDAKLAEGVAKGEMDILLQGKDVAQPKPTITNVSEFPTKEYTFTGEWERQTLGSGNKAIRNRETVWYPIYKSEDGKVILDATQVSKLDPTSTSLSANDQQAGRVQNAKGAVTFGADGMQATIHAFEAADFTTLIHENGHVFRRVLSDVAERTGNAQIKADLATIEDWAGVKDGKWEREHEEKFARGFENYIATGKAPLPKLQAAFEMFRTWMLDVYKSITGSAIDVRLSEDVRQVFDRMLGAEEQSRVQWTEDGISAGDDVYNRLRDNGQTNLKDLNSLRLNKRKTIRQVTSEIAEMKAYNSVFNADKIVERTDFVRRVTEELDGIERYISDLKGDALREKSQRNLDKVKSGQPTETLFQRAEPIETPAFKNLFGKSKVVDREGRPLVVYHGTGTDITEFSLRKANDLEGRRRGLGLGRNKIYLDGEPAVASAYAENAPNRRLGKNPNVMPLYVNIEKPISLSDYHARFKELVGKEIYDSTLSMKERDEAIGKVDKALKTEGYDGVIEFHPDGTIGQIAAFYPEQIKSVANRGTFDPANPNILFQEADQPFGSYDAASQFHPQSEVMDAGWRESINPLLDAMQEGALNQLNEKPLDGATRDMSPEGQKMLNGYINKVKSEMATTKLATIRHAETRRDFAMLNYSKRYGFDRVAETVYPYQFYQTRTMVNWALRALDKPAILSNYARLHNQQNRYERDIPERLRGKIKINAPWLPDWMGDGLYIDPLGSLFPPASLLKPFDRMSQQHTQQQLEAERILQEWTADGKYSENEIQQAMQTRSGKVYERAFAEAQARRESEVNNPIDFFNSMFGPAWYLTTPYKLATGKANEVTSTPLGNTSRALETVTKGTWAEPAGQLFGLLGKAENWGKKKLGIPEYGEYGDYYIDRQLANMVADGLINSEQAQIAMVERQGETFAAAEERVKLELALRVPTMGGLYAALHEGSAGDKAKAALTSLFGASLLPAGELEYRGLKQEWNEAWKRKDAGDTQAITNFFEDHPEYESYLAKGKEPEERLKSFLIGQIWDGYMALGKTNQKQASAEMGEAFKQSFLDKETRSYDTLDVDTLTQWAQMLGKMTPKTTPPLTTPQVSTLGEGNTTPKLDLYSPEVTSVTDQFFAQRSEKFPNYYEVQAGYYNLATKGEKARYLAEHPDLKAYWDWKDKWYKAYPSYKPIFNGDAFKQVDTSGWPPMLEDYVRNYAYTGQKLPNGAYKSLEQVWITEGQPMGDFKSWLNSQVVPGILYGSGQ